MRESENIRQLIDLKPDYIGYIFYPKSKRYVGDEPDESIFSIVPDSVNKVGVFVNEQLETVIKKLRKFNLQVAQLHGGESPEFCSKVMEKSFEVVKAFSVDNSFNFSETDQYTGCVNYFLFDTKTDQYGGSGKKFDWAMLENYTGKTPVILSGGITVTDTETIKKLSYGFVKVLDINSKFETEPALKDISMIRKFKKELER